MNGCMHLLANSLECGSAQTYMHHLPPLYSTGTHPLTMHYSYYLLNKTLILMLAKLQLCLVRNGLEDQHINSHIYAHVLLAR